MLKILVFIVLVVELVALFINMLLQERMKVQQIDQEERDRIFDHNEREDEMPGHRGMQLRLAPNPQRAGQMGWRYCENENRMTTQTVIKVENGKRTWRCHTCQREEKED